jgi:hypothetical protein
VCALVVREPRLARGVQDVVCDAARVREELAQGNGLLVFFFNGLARVGEALDYVPGFQLGNVLVDRLV